jgi:hypothetical protein
MSNPLDYKSSFAVFRFPRVFPQKYANPNVYHAFRMEPGRTVTNHFEPPGVTPIYALTRVHPALQFLWNILGVGKAYAYGSR